ncbi:hypothetical protein LCGC14_0669420 [marine sediment metagenome]|uniref:Uncharacterized protein n=1 Tax=marine sediment metagenome TaxID=412755 RepID=A0A0F9TZN4_9ZZZZ
MGLPDDVYKNMKRMFPDMDIQKPIRSKDVQPNRPLSKTLGICKPVDAIALKSFSDIKKGDTCQVTLMPFGMIYLGHFGQYGSGTVYKSDAIEGTDFNFKP